MTNPKQADTSGQSPTYESGHDFLSELSQIDKLSRAGEYELAACGTCVLLLRELKLQPQLSDDHVASFESGIESLFLWTTNFRANGLRTMLTDFHDLAGSVRHHIARIGVKLKAEYRSLVSTQSAGALWLLDDLNTQIRHLQIGSKDSSLDSIDSKDDSESSDTSESEAEEELSYHVRCLNKLVPTLVRLQRQIDAPDPQLSGIEKPVSEKPMKPADLSKRRPRTSMSSRRTSTSSISRQAIDKQSRIFRKLLLTLSQIPMTFENPALLDDALRYVPVDRLMKEVDHAKGAVYTTGSLQGDRDWTAAAGRDLLLRSLLIWFKTDFFEQIDNTLCSLCQQRTIFQGLVSPTVDEAADSAHEVELYVCRDPVCKTTIRFARYTDPWILMSTRRGRAYEFSNCFAMLCRALDTRIRWIWNSEDNVWIEIYSEHERRWIHVDPYLGLWDQPQIYVEGGQKLAYCIGFSNDGIADVTRRYVRNPYKSGRPRRRCSEEVLRQIMWEIRDAKRTYVGGFLSAALQQEDEDEEYEMQRYVREALFDAISTAFKHHLTISFSGNTKVNGKKITPDEELQPLVTQTKMYVAVMLQVRKGPDLHSILRQKLREEDEVTWSAIPIKPTLLDTKPQEGHGKTIEHSSISEMSFAQLRHIVLQNVSQLESLGLMSSANAYQDFLEEMVSDISRKQMPATSSRWTAPFSGLTFVPKSIASRDTPEASTMTIQEHKNISSRPPLGNTTGRSSRPLLARPIIRISRPVTPVR